ncbi:MAG: efflux RND transporter periplasmic adaptor subunit [Candidatus Doudnabacteria bacterium]|nr:efflux RND transporter periplasmic adaptor subunit [Candidatus Doudnabacteria bacterium]
MNFPFRLTKKRIIWTIIILLVLAPIAYRVFKPKDNSKNIITEIAKKQDLKQTVLATGQVVSETDLSLSFKVSGFVSSVSVKEGQKVKKGQILANLDQRDQVAALTSARGAYDLAQANYQKVLEGATNEEVAVTQKALDAAQSTLDNTIAQQNTAVSNSYKALLNSAIGAIPAPNNSGSAAVTISGTYAASEQGVYKIAIYNDAFIVTGLENSSGKVLTTEVPLGSRGLYITFSGNIYNGDQWTVQIPNTLASTYVTNYNAYQAALQAKQVAVEAAKASLDQAKAALALKKAKSRPADLKASEAQVLSAQGQVLSAQASVENTVIRAPADGTITSVDIKPGELAVSLKEAIVLQDVGSLHLEANISEANIALVKEGQSIEVTLDALGSDRIFEAKVQTVNPASTLVSGVVNYKVVASLGKLESVRPGMTANLTILTGEKFGVLAIPQRAVVQNGKKKVRVVDNTKRKTFHEVEVESGMEADGGLVEIISGLNEGQEVVTFIKK